MLFVHKSVDIKKPHKVHLDSVPAHVVTRHSRRGMFLMNIERILNANDVNLRMLDIISYLSYTTDSIAYDHIDALD